MDFYSEKEKKAIKLSLALDKIKYILIQNEVIDDKAITDITELLERFKKQDSFTLEV